MSTQPTENSRESLQTNLARDHITQAYLGLWGGTDMQARTQSRIHWMAGQVTGERVLDIGCSEGILAILLAREGFQVIGVDVNADALAYAQEMLDRENDFVKGRVTFLHADLLSAPLETEAYDTVVLGEILEHLTQPKFMLERALTLLKAGGAIIITTPFGYHPDPDHRQTFSLSRFLGLARLHLSPTHLSIVDNYIRFSGVKTVSSAENWAGYDSATLLNMVEQAIIEQQHVLRDSISRFKERSEKLNDQLKSRTGELNELKKLSQECDTACTSLQQQLKRLSSDHEQLRTASEILQVERDELQSKLREAEQNFDKLTSELRQTHEQCQNADLQTAILRADLDKTEEEKQLALQALHESGQSNLSVLNQLQNVETENADLKRRIEQAETGRVETLHDFQNLQDQNTVLKRRIKKAENDLQVEKKKTAQLHDLLIERRMARDRAAINYHVTRRQYEILNAAYATRVGGFLVQAVTRPGLNTLALPWRLIRLTTSAIRKRLRRTDSVTGVLQCQLADNRTTSIPLTVNRPTLVAAHDDQIFFSIPSGQSAYLTTKQNSNFAKPPVVNYFHLNPNQTYHLEGRIQLSGGQATLWMLEFDTRKCLTKRNLRLTNGPFHLTITTHHDHVFLCPAIRLAGRGMITLGLFSVRDTTERVAEPDKPEPATPAGTSDRTVRGLRELSHTLPLTSYRSLLGWPKAGQGDFRAMCVLDEFSHDCFAPECTLITPRPDNWREVLELENPQALFVESAWKGNGGCWQYRVGAYSPRPGNELFEMVRHCNEQGIPTVFWNKEDPVHYDKFIEAASDFQYIFTTDQASVDRYRRETKAQYVQALQFAAQSRMHNPIAAGPRNDRVCFAGSYYANRFAERRIEQIMLLEAAAQSNLDIYDRFAGHTGPYADHFLFPEHLRTFVRGRLSYQETIAAYKRYRVFLNVNSVVDSETMFSRRVFELLACGTPVVSTWSWAIEKTFGPDLVWMIRSPEEAREALHTLTTNDHEWRRRSIQGIRAVFAAHTYRHRLETILEAAFPQRSAPDEQTSVLFVGKAAIQEDAHQLLSSFVHLVMPGKRLLLAAPEPPNQTPADVNYLGAETDLPACLEESLRQTQAAFLGLLSPQRLYGRHYAQDLLHALTYSGADAAGKATDGQDHYRFHNDLDLFGTIFRVDALRAGINGLRRLLETDAATDWHDQGLRLFAADAANFAEAPACGRGSNQLSPDCEI